MRPFFVKWQYKLGLTGKQSDPQQTFVPRAPLGLVPYSEEIYLALYFLKKILANVNVYYSRWWNYNKIIYFPHRRYETCKFCGKHYVFSVKGVYSVEYTYSSLCRGIIFQSFPPTRPFIIALTTCTLQTDFDTVLLSLYLCM